MLSLQYLNVYIKLVRAEIQLGLQSFFLRLETGLRFLPFKKKAKAVPKYHATSNQLL